jgi:hypothetical protein
MFEQYPLFPSSAQLQRTVKFFYGRGMASFGAEKL